MKYIKIISSVVLICSIAGCASAPIKPTEIQGRTVINKSIGFSEWRITFPVGYAQFIPKDGAPKSNGQVASNFAHSIDKQSGWTVREHLVFESNFGAIAMSTVSIDTVMFDRTQLGVLAGVLAKGFSFPSGTVIDRKVVTINGRQVAKISRKLGSSNTYNSVYRVPVQPRYTVDFNSYCGFDDRAKIDADIESAISTLTAK